MRQRVSNRPEVVAAFQTARDQGWPVDSISRTLGHSPLPEARPSAADRLAEFREQVERCLDPQSEDFEEDAQRPSALAFAAADAFVAKYPLTDPRFLWAGNPSFDLFLSRVDGDDWEQVTVRFLGDGSVLIGKSTRDCTVGVWPLAQFKNAEHDLTQICRRGSRELEVFGC